MGEYYRYENETQDELIYRICSEKESIGTWQQVADILNKLLDNDYNESAYRKKYQAFNKILDANQAKFVSADSQLEELKEAKLELEKMKVRLRDERTALNKQYRELGRNDQDYDILKRMISENSEVRLIPKTEKNDSGNDMLVCISDFHIGATNSSSFGEYNTDIAKERLEKYLSEIIRIQKIHNSKNCYLSLLGDLIDGNIHLTIRITNRENLIEQIKIVSELLSSFVKELANVFDNVYIASVSGNHTRCGKKDDCLRDERTDDLVPWYMEAKLDKYSNVKFIKDKIDPSIGNISIRGNEYLMVHGDWDSYSERGVNKLVMMTRSFPTGIIYGHMHKCSYDDINGVKIIRSGAFSGTGDDYCISKRIRGNASQMACICTEKGVEACYPIQLD